MASRMSYYRVIAEDENNDGVGLADVRVSAYLLSFFRDTSMAGFPMVIKQPGLIKKFFWLCGIGCMAFLLYWECDAATAVNIQTSRKLYFPAITVCNNNPVTYDWYDPEGFQDTHMPGGGGGGGGSGSGSGSGGGSGTVASGASTAAGTGAPATGATSATSATGSTTAAPAGTSATAAGTTAAGPPATTPVGRKRRENPSNLDREKRQMPAGANQGGSNGGSNSGGSSGGGGQMTMPDFSGSMQSKLEIQEKAASVHYDNRSVVGHQLCDMILQCQYAGESCSPSTAFDMWHYNPEFGNCYTFNAGYKIVDSPANGNTNDLWTLKLGGDTADGIKISTHTGDAYGLYLLLNADTDHYVTTTTQVGWRIAIHNQTEMPFPEETGVFVEPGTSTRIGISLSYIQQLSSVTNVLYTAKYSDCVEKTDYVEDDFYNAYSNFNEVAYTATACYNTCYQRAVINACSCFDFLYPNRGSAFDSSKATVPCSFQNDTQWLCREEIRAKFNSDGLGCSDECPETCMAYSFNTVISSLRWPNPDSRALSGVCSTIYDIMTKRIAGNDSTCTGTSAIASMVEGGGSYKLLDDLAGCAVGSFHEPIGSYYELADYIIGNQFAEVYIYYKDFNYQTIVASEFLELADLLAYMGGILGLFFGFTFMTLMEYIQLLFDLILIGCAKLCCKRTKVDPYAPPNNGSRGQSSVFRGQTAKGQAMIGNNIYGSSQAPSPAVSVQASKADLPYPAPPE